MTTSASAPPSQVGLYAALAAITVVAVVATLTYPLLTLLMERADESGAAIGFNTALAAVGIVAAGPLLGPRLTTWGAPAVMLGCIATMIGCLAGFAATYDFALWCALRFLLGLATGGLFLASEYWVLAQAPPARRGRWVALYAFLLAGGYAVGPALLRVVGVDGVAPFAAAGAVAFLAALPILAAWRRAPDIDHAAAPTAAWRSALANATLVAAVVLFGVIEFGAMGMTPVWGRALGYTEDEVIVFTIWLAAGGFVFLPLLGWAADRFPARPLLILVAAVSIAVALALPYAASDARLIWAAFFLWGGTAAGLYTVSLSAMGARYQDQPTALAGGNAALVMAYGVGALVGPPLAGGALDIFGPSGLPLSFGALAAIFIGLAAARGLIRAERSG